MNTQTEPTSTTPASQTGKKKKMNKKRESEQENPVNTAFDRMLENGQLTSKLQTSLYEQMGLANKYLNEHASLQVLVYGTFLLGLIPTIMFGVYLFSTFAALFGAAFLGFCVLGGLIIGFGLAFLVPVLLTCFGIMLFLISGYYFARYAYEVGCRVQYWLENSVNPPAYRATLYPIENNHRTLQHVTDEPEEVEQPLSDNDVPAS